MKTVLILALLSLSGCALAPTAVRLEAQHVSHIEQHFAALHDDQQYGYNSIGVDLHWQLPARFSADIVEGAILGDCTYNPPIDHCEGLAGPREVFNARVDYTLWGK